MGYSIINFNYSGDAEGVFENDALNHINSIGTYSEPHFKKFDVPELIARLQLNPFYGYPNQTTGEYIKACDRMIEFCKFYTSFSYYGQLFEKKKIGYLWLQIRIEEVKQKIQNGSSFKDALEPYELSDEQPLKKYKNPNLFKESQKSVNKKACERANAGMAKCTANSSYCLSTHLKELNWLIKWSNPSDENFRIVIVDILLNTLTANQDIDDSWNKLDEKLDTALLNILYNEQFIRILHTKNVLANFYILLRKRRFDLTGILANDIHCLNMLITNSPSASLQLLKFLNTGTRLDETILGLVFSSENLVSKFDSDKVLGVFLAEFMHTRKFKFDSYFLSNINFLDTLAKINPEFFVSLVKNVESKVFFRLALQRGFNFQHCLPFLKTKFDILSSELTLVLYEALSRGINTIAKDLVEFNNSHKIEKNEVKTTSIPLTMFAASSRQTVTTHQQLTSYDETVIAFSFDDLLKYLQEKFQQTTKQNEPNSTPKETLHFIKHPKAFMQSLVRLQLISKENSKEFTVTFCTEFNIPPNEVLEAEERNIAEVPNFLKMFEAMQKQIQELQAGMLKMEAKHATEIKELKDKIEQLENPQPKSNYQAP